MKARIAATILIMATLGGAALAQPLAPDAAAAIQVEAAWARPTVGRATVGAAYFAVRNRGAAGDRLVAVSTPAAGRAELHQTVQEGTVARMRPVAVIALAAGGAATLQPGGLHVMLLELREPLRAGATFPLTLQFERAGAVTTTVTVRDPRAAPPAGHSGH